MTHGSCLLLFLFIFLYKTLVGSFIFLYPGEALRLKKNSIWTLIPLTIEQSTQSHFRRILSIDFILNWFS